MLSVLRAVEVVIDVDEETRAVRTDRRRWGELCPVECPSVDSIVWSAVIDKDLVSTGDKYTPRIWEIGRNDGRRGGASIEPDDDLTTARTGRNNRVIDGDKEAVRGCSDGVARGEGGGIGIPGGIGTEPWLVEWTNWK